ncbi:MAG: TetR/AcrR family transcriptional regulator [Rhodoferax sp.]|nr:TetR/AcrR family transcriptional regulator [Rhodoferax sp.]
MTTRKANKGPRSDNRIQELLDAAAHLFSKHGYSATSMRDIASSVDMLSGSLYYHFPSKEELLVAVYSAGVTQLVDATSEALKKESDPWTRLEALCRAHLEVVLKESDYAQVLIRVIPSDIPSVAERLLELRDAYEEVFRKVVSDLPLPLGADRKTLRLMLIGSLNWALFWFDPQGRDSPHVLARKFVGLLKESQNV